MEFLPALMNLLCLDKDMYSSRVPSVWAAFLFLILFEKFIYPSV